MGFMVSQLFGVLLVGMAATDPMPRQPCDDAVFAVLASPTTNERVRHRRRLWACLEDDDSDESSKLERRSEGHGRLVVEPGRIGSPSTRRPWLAGPSGAGTHPLIYLLSRLLL
jgi:hypothetical protein